MPVDKAKEQYMSFRELLKKKKTQYLLDMKNATYQLSKGKELIDIYKTFGAIALEDDMPKLAIVRADADTCYFEKRPNGSGCFWHRPLFGDGRKDKILFPAKTFDFKNQPSELWHSSNHRATTIPPTIPAPVYPEFGLHNYFLLWEVERGGWLPQPTPPFDPFLLKRITKNLFVPLAAWDLTPLEQSILSGLNAPEK